MRSLFIIIISFLLSSMVSAAPTGSAINIEAPGGKKLKLYKVPKSMFLLKKAKVDANVGEPQFYPVESQLRTINNDPLLNNLSRFK